MYIIYWFLYILQLESLKWLETFIFLFYFLSENDNKLSINRKFMSLFIFVPFRVGEEREGAVKCLDDERQVYERELSLLQQQQQKVLTDRNGKNDCAYLATMSSQQFT